MLSGVYKKYLVYGFLFIFMCKLGLAIAPVLIESSDPRTVRQVIMQLEQEHHESDAKKDLAGKSYLCIDFFHFSQHRCSDHLPQADLAIEWVAKHIQPFYPSVPTPPPNLS